MSTCTHRGAAFNETGVLRLRRQNNSIFATSRHSEGINIIGYVALTESSTARITELLLPGAIELEIQAIRLLAQAT